MIILKHDIIPEGEDFIKTDASKMVTFMIVMPLFYATLLILNFLSIEGTLLERSVFCISVFILICFFYLKNCFKAIKMKQKIIRRIEIDENTVKVFITLSLSKDILIYTFDKNDLMLEKGISLEDDKTINFFNLSDTYTLQVKNSKRLQFFFITPYWENWESIKKYFQEYNE